MIRAATSADADAIWALIEPVFRAGETMAVPRDIGRADALALWMNGSTYVDEGPDGVLGTYYIRTNKPGGGAHVCNCGYIVSEAARGQGLARRMCEHSQDEARALGYRAMQFNFVLASNVGAVGLWQRLGFDTVGTIPDAFDHPHAGLVDAFVMYKRLTA